MDLSSISNEELIGHLRSLAPASSRAEADHDRLQEVVQEPDVHPIELEMQNRALRDVQAELELTLQRYTDLYDHLPIGYVTLTRMGQIVQANLTAARWLRRDRSKLAGLHINWFLDAFDAGRFAAHLDLCAQSRSQQTCEITLRLENDLTLNVQLSSHAAPHQMGVPHIHTAITNISGVKQGRATLDDLDREQNAVAALGGPGATEPVASVSTLARQLLTEHRANLSGEALSVIERLEGAALRMETMLQHLVQYCSLGREGVARDPVNLDELVQQVLLEHRDVITRRGADVQIARPLPGVRGSRLMLAQVLANLLINALKNPPQDQSLRIGISAETRDDTVILTIPDDGIRPPADEQQFRVFERLHGSRRFLADGIGFALVRRAIESMNGRVWVESGPAQGHAFKIELRRV